MQIKFNIKGIIYGVCLVLFILLGFLVLPNMFKEDIKPVDYILVEREAIPDKILDMMDNYIDKERALSLIVDDKVYVIATRGQNTDYGIIIDKITMQEKEGKQVMCVSVIYKEKEEAYPFVVVETNLKALPNKIELEKKFEAKNNSK